MVHYELDPTTTEVLSFLHDIFRINKYRTINVVGTTCCGKSTLVERIIGAVDMDKALFPLLTEAEKTSVCQKPWTPQIGAAMSELAKKYLNIEPGKPVFSTVVLDADVIIHMVISDALLTARAAARGVDPADALNMRAQIEHELSNTPAEVYTIWLG